MNSWILYIQVLLISAGAVFLAMGIKFTVPVAVNEVSSIVLSWLRPPYLHLLINAIIITIAAASRFRRTRPEPPAVQSHQHLISVKTPPPAYFAALPATPEIRTIVEVPPAAYYGEDRVVELKPVMVNGSEVDIEGGEEETVADGGAEADDAFLDPTSTYNPPSPETFSPESQLEYIVPVKPIENVPERVEEARHETMESTWKKIMEGRSRATHEPPQEPRRAETPRPLRHRSNVLKSKSCKERTGNVNPPPGPASSGIRKEISPSLDELNRRVEAFIKKVNEEMRLRRQESLNQYMETFNT